MEPRWLDDDEMHTWLQVVALAEVLPARLDAQVRQDSGLTHFEYQVLAMLLGGAPHARLDRVLREERGYTYGVRLGFRPRSVGGTTVVAGSVRADATVGEISKALQNVWGTYTEQPRI